jgi:hypothetical protein
MPYPLRRKSGETLCHALIENRNMKSEEPDGHLRNANVSAHFSRMDPSVGRALSVFLQWMKQFVIHPSVIGTYV